MTENLISKQALAGNREPRSSSVFEKMGVLKLGVRILSIESSNNDRDVNFYKSCVSKKINLLGSGNSEYSHQFLVMVPDTITVGTLRSHIEVQFHRLYKEMISVNRLQDENHFDLDEEYILCHIFGHDSRIVVAKVILVTDSSTINDVPKDYILAPNVPSPPIESRYYQNQVPEAIKDDCTARKLQPTIPTPTESPLAVKPSIITESKPNLDSKYSRDKCLDSEHKSNPIELPQPLKLVPRQIIKSLNDTVDSEESSHIESSLLNPVDRERIVVHVNNTENLNISNNSSVTRTDHESKIQMAPQRISHSLNINMAPDSSSEDSSEEDNTFGLVVKPVTSQKSLRQTIPVSKVHSESDSDSSETTTPQPRLSLTLLNEELKRSASVLSQISTASMDTVEGSNKNTNKPESTMNGENSSSIPVESPNVEMIKTQPSKELTSASHASVVVGKTTVSKPTPLINGNKPPIKTHSFKRPLAAASSDKGGEGSPGSISKRRMRKIQNPRKLVSQNPGQLNASPS